MPRGKKGDVKNTEPKARLLDDVSDRTRRMLLGILLFLAAFLLALAGFRTAGPAGDYLFSGVSYLFGIWYYALPFAAIIAGIACMRTPNEERAVARIRLFGAGTLAVSILGLTSIIKEGTAGAIGFWIAYPLLGLFELYAATIVLLALGIISLLLLFDSRLDLGLVTFFRRLFSRSEPSMEDEEVSPEPLPALQSAPAVTVSEYDEEVDDSTDTLPAPSPSRTLGSIMGFGAKKPVEAPIVSNFGPYTPPPLSILERDRGKPNVGDTKASANLIKRTLNQFGIKVEMDEISVGPTVTRYALKPAEGVRLSKIVGLQSNLELALAASPIRIEAPIPGKSLVGIEVPNIAKATIGLASLLGATEFIESPKPLLLGLGKDITGTPRYADLAKMPHALIAGTTGSGKSVTIHSLVAALLYRNGPERLRLILIDPKRVELTLYNDIPHLYGTPVITDAKKAILALKWAAKEMDRRYDILNEHRVRDIVAYHTTILAPALKKREEEKESGTPTSELPSPDLMPHIVVIIDELADIMQTYPRELEASIVRLAQMSRAVGIHLILSTQRPSVNVITGLIKANIPTRIALQVASQIDSRTILDMPGAEKLLGAGDMLYLGSEMAKPVRLQSPFVTDAEVKKLVEYLINNDAFGIQTGIDFGEVESAGTTFAGNVDDNGGDDPMYEDARETVIAAGKASTSLLQRKLRVGYGRAARLIDMLYDRGVIGPADGSKPRDVLIAGGGSTNAVDES